MFRQSLVLMIAAGLLALFVGTGSAIFTSSASVNANTFTTGTVVLNTSTNSGLVTFANMAPGDMVTAPLTVSNAGSLQLRYAMTTAISGETNGLASQLTLEIKTGATCTNAGFSGSGTDVYPLGTLANGAIGNPAQGAQAGDRTLNAGANEVLCFQVTLPIGSGNGFQNSTATAAFTFAGEQTANN